MDIGIKQIKPNFTKVNVGTVTVWFSYETPIAFKNGTWSTLVVRENVWGTTTGKHLNWVDGGDKEAKERRVSSDEFNAALNGLLKWLGLGN